MEASIEGIQGCTGVQSIQEIIVRYTIWGGMCGNKTTITASVGSRLVRHYGSKQKGCGQLNIVDIDLYKERREQILRHLRVVERKMPISSLQTPQTRTINRKRFILTPFMPHREAHKHQVHHATHAVKWKMKVLLPNGIEAVVLDYSRAVSDSAGGCCVDCRRG